jgi:hypothetical protein
MTFLDWQSRAVFQISQVCHGRDLDDFCQKPVCLEGKSNMMHKLEEPRDFCNNTGM